MYTSDPLQNWFARLDRRTYGLLLGAGIGLVAGVLGVALTLVGPVVTIIGVIGLLIGLYILTSVSAALYSVILIMFLLPFGALPVKIGFTPTLLDVALGAFVLVYLFQWMTGRRTFLRLTPVHILIVIYALWLIFSFIMGLRHSSPTSQHIRQFAETLLSISLVVVIVDLLRDTTILRRLVLVVIIGIGIQTLMTIGLYVLPDAMTENLLVRLARIGYPNGGVIRYIEDNPALDERAIGTWVDPNTLGGVLALSAVMIAPQVFARKPVLRYRWLTFVVLVLVALALFLTYSRASMLAFAAGLLLIAVVRYRKFIPLLILGAALLLLLPQTQEYLERFLDAFRGADLATQMRLGEYGDSLRLISRYPIFGVGFTGTPEIDIYTDAASMYLIMANQIGLVGVGIFLTMILGIFTYGYIGWGAARSNDQLDSIHLGYHAALLTGLVNGVADLYFFRLDFQGTITLFWLVIALALASSRMALELRASESTVVKQI